MNNEQETVLIHRVRKGDRQAFAELAAPYRERVYKTALRLLGNREDALEVTQEALLQTFLRLTGFRGTAHFYTWLYQIALNLSAKRLRERYRQPLVSSPGSSSGEESLSPEAQLADSGRSALEEAAGREQKGLVRQALGKLKPADLTLLLLREFEELPYEAIAERLRIPKGTVMSRLHRIRLELARHLERFGVQA